MVRSTLALAIMVLMSCSALSVAARPNAPFSPDDLFNLEVATDPQISPDGSRIAYVRRFNDIMTDRLRSSIRVIDRKTGRETQLEGQAGDTSQPRWSPDGERLAYLSVSGGTASLVVRNMAKGNAVDIAVGANSPGMIRWSPDGETIAYVASVIQALPTPAILPPKPPGAKWAPPLEIIDRVDYRSDGKSANSASYDHLFVVAATGGAPRQITFGSFDDRGPLSWSRDGKTLLFTTNRAADAQSRPLQTSIYAVDVADATLTRLTSRKGLYGAPTLSPDGKWIAFVGYDDKRHSYQVNELYVMRRDGSGLRSLTATLDRSIEQAVWAKDGRSLLISFDDHAQRMIARLHLDGRTETLMRGLAGASLDRPYTGGQFTVSDRGLIAYTSSGSGTRPADLFVEGMPLTHLNQAMLARTALAKTRKLPVVAADGRAIDAWLVTPPGTPPGRKLPTILEIHGGPYTAYGDGFSSDFQLFAAAGYAVLYVNPRGSTSYGEGFAQLIDRNFPGDDYADLMSAVDAAIAEGTTDPKALFVTGGSAGGIMTTWIVGKTDRFLGAAAQKPAVNWISSTLLMDLTYFSMQYEFDKTPWVDPMSYWARSPLSLVGHVTTPTMLIVGDADYRTPVSEAEQYYAALKVAGVETRLVKVPGAGHVGLAARPSQSIARIAEILAWFDRFRSVKRP